MNYTAVIQRYQNGATDTIQIEIPGRVTITGEEDHFRRAYEDVSMAVAGMRAMDGLEARRIADDTGKMMDPVRYRVVSIKEY